MPFSNAKSWLGPGAKMPQRFWGVQVQMWQFPGAERGWGWDCVLKGKGKMLLDHGGDRGDRHPDGGEQRKNTPGSQGTKGKCACIRMQQEMQWSGEQ